MAEWDPLRSALRWVPIRCSMRTREKLVCPPLWPPAIQWTSRNDLNSIRCLPHRAHIRPHQPCSMALTLKTPPTMHTRPGKSCKFIEKKKRKEPKKREIQEKTWIFSRRKCSKTKSEEKRQKQWHNKSNWLNDKDLWGVAIAMWFALFHLYFICESIFNASMRQPICICIYFWILLCMLQVATTPAFAACVPDVCVQRSRIINTTNGHQVNSFSRHASNGSRDDRLCLEPRPLQFTCTIF